MRKFLHWLTSQPVLWLGFVCLAIVLLVNPVKGGLLLYGISKLAIFAWLGRWVDTWVFLDSRPEDLEGPAQGGAWKRRAWIVCAAILAGSQVP